MASMAPHPTDWTLAHAMRRLDYWKSGRDHDCMPLHDHHQHHHTAELDARPRRHRQDRQPRRGPPDRPRPPRPRRLPRRRPALRLGGPRHLGRRARGAGAAYISFQPDLAVPGAAETVGAFAERAVAHGVRRLVLLSGRGEPEAQAAEAAVRASGAEVTVVRASWFMQNFSESFFRDGVLAGEVAAPVGDVREPFVDADDIADVAVAALTRARARRPGLRGDRPAGDHLRRRGRRDRRGHGPRARVHLGPRRRVPRRAGRRTASPPRSPALLRYLFTEVLDGRNTAVADGVQRALGRPPRSFAAYARTAAAAGAWAVAACR